ncbi:mycothiol transferase [Microlunatus soli]|nr:DUF664 domain-containing protein [Microlunatus soli]
MDYNDIPIEDCPSGSEGELLLFALDRVHRQFAWKSGGLDADRLRQVHPPSKLTIAGLIKHLAGVEAHWTAWAQEQSVPAPWDAVDRAAQPRWDWESAVTDHPEQLYALWYDTIARSRQAWEVMIKDGGLDKTVPWGGDDYIVNRRCALVDILEENLLHTGQASIVRESIDGLTGNDPP